MPRPRIDAAVAFCALFCTAFAAHAEVPVYAFDIVHVYPHDTSAFTEGLFYWNG